MTANTNEKQNQRRELSKKAWREAYARVNSSFVGIPDLACCCSHEIGLAEKEANEATEAYVRTGKAGARAALKKWEDLMMLAIRAAKLARGCDECHVEKVVEVVDQDGRRSCGRCRAGTV